MSRTHRPASLVHFLLFCLLNGALFLSTLNFTLAANNPLNKTTSVSASVPDHTPPSIPILIAPENNALLNTLSPTFIFTPSLDTESAIDHYELVVDSTVFFAAIPVSTTATAEFTSTATPELISLRFLTPTHNLTEGTHSWAVVAYDTAGNFVSSATWSFTLDTTAPDLTLWQVAENEGLNLTPSSTTNLTLNTSQTEVIFSGTSEPASTIIVSLTQTNCSLDCLTYQFQTETNSAGQFSLTTTSLPLAAYSVSVQAIDLATNTSQLNPFTLNITQATTTPPLPPSVIPPIAKITQLKNNPVISQLNRLVTIPTALTISLLLALNLAISLGLSLQYLPRLLWYYLLRLLTLLGLRHDHDWGVIYNSYTKKPLPLAMITCFASQPSGASAYDPLIATAFSDIRGHFSLPLKPGYYHLRVSKSNYSYPDTQITQPTDPPYINIYHGEPIYLGPEALHPTQSSQPMASKTGPIFVFYLPPGPTPAATNPAPLPPELTLQLSIPLTPLEPNLHSRLQHLAYRAQAFLDLANTYLYILGMLLTIWLFFTTPLNPLTFLLILVYTGLTFVRRTLTKVTKVPEVTKVTKVQP